MFDVDTLGGGAPPTVVLLHSSASSARQWDALGEVLRSRFRVLAVDLHGHGARAPRADRARTSLADDAALIEPLLARTRSGVHLVGHSYGGAVALRLAGMYPRSVRSLVAFEPVLFRLLIDDDPQGAPAREVLSVAEAMGECVDEGRPLEGARIFVDFWSGEGAWERLPPARQAAIASRMPAVMSHFEALFHEGRPHPGLSHGETPMLFLTGERTVPATRRVRELLVPLLPEARHELMPHMGHMGPITHPAQVNARIAEFLGRAHAPFAAWI